MARKPTTLGRLLVQDVLPNGASITEQLSKKKLHGMLLTMAKEDMEDTAPRIDQLRALGHELATTEGISATLDDIEPDPELKTKYLKPALAKLQNVDNQEDRRRILSELHPRVSDAAMRHPGTLALMVRSGARGKPVQLMKNLAAPVMALEANGDPYPWLVHHSYAEGLRNSEAWTTAIETRNNQINTRLAVTEPGDLSKILAANMANQLVLAEDCGTSNGVMMDVDDSNTVDRYMARPEAGFPRNTLVTPQVLTKLRAKKVDSVMVRSPMTCEQHDGVCQKCYGLNEKGRLQGLGTNVGVVSAQALSEPLTQFALSAKHGVRTTTTDKATAAGHRGLRQLMDVPENFPNRAAVAPVSDRIEKITKAPQGGHFIRIGGQDIYTPPDLDPIVRPGQNVEAGDVLTEGIHNPADVVAYKGLGVGRKYLVDQLHRIYKNQGLDIDRRHLEVLAKSQLNQVRIDEDPEDRFYPGEVVEYNSLARILSEDLQDVSIDDAVGKALGRPYLHFSVGTTITPSVASELKKNNIKRIAALRRAPKFVSIMHSITTSPLANPDWMARLGSRQLAQSILQGAQFGEEADIHGAHPVPALAFGAEFGEGPDRRY